VSSHLSEEEQIESLRKWWQENGRALIIGVVVAVVLVLGWDAWKQQKARMQAEASVAYQNLLDTIGTPGTVLDDVAFTTAKHLTERLQADASSTAYATYAALLMARVYVDRDDLAAAGLALQWAVANAADKTLEDLARLRMAQVQFALGQADEALAALQAFPADSYLTALVLQLKGDILVSRGDRAAALEAYQAALDWLSANDKNPVRLLEVKRDALRVADPANTIPAAQPAGKS